MFRYLSPGRYFTTNIINVTLKIAIIQQLICKNIINIFLFYISKLDTLDSHDLIERTSGSPYSCLNFHTSISFHGFPKLYFSMYLRHCLSSFHLDLMYSSTGLSGRKYPATKVIITRIKLNKTKNIAFLPPKQQQKPYMKMVKLSRLNAIVPIVF